MSLPVEIYRDIISYISDREVLRTLLCTSHVLKDEAERGLLRKINMDFMSSPSRKAYNQRKRIQMTKTFEHIRRNPNLALAVHELRYSPLAVSKELVEVVIPLMTKLSRLYLSKFYSLPTRCTFRLSFLRLSCLEVVDNSSKRDLLGFLAAQPSITELDLLGEIVIHPKLLPNLTVLSIHNKHSVRLLHHRLITRLCVYVELHNEDFPDHTCIEHIRVLYCPNPESYFDWSPFKNLEYLAVLDVRRRLNFPIFII